MLNKLLEASNDVLPEVTETVTILDKVGTFISDNSVYIFTAVAVLVGVYVLREMLAKSKKKRKR